MPRFGLMGPDEERRLPFNVPVGYIPFLKPGGTCHIVQQSSDSITLKNKGSKSSSFLLVFITQSQLQQIMAAKTVVETIAGLKSK